MICLFLLRTKNKNPCKALIYRDFLCFTILSSGETGIRTPDTLLGYTRFPSVPLQPLEHLSFSGRKSKGSFRNHQIFGINNLSNAYKIKPNPSSFPKKRLSINSITSILLTKMRRFLYLLEQNKTTIRLCNSKTTNPSF